MFYVTESHTFEDIIKKSRFIGIIFPCLNDQDVFRQLKALQAEHPHANHIAFAYRIKTNDGVIYRFHDAGEPTGTAGKPIFQHIEGKNIINALVVVIRYFGGVKLGAGGLTRAYGHMAKQAIDTAALHPYIEMATLHFTLDYERFQSFDYALKKVNGHIIEQVFAGQIHLTVTLPVEKQSDLESQFATV
ncbi:IMPACT family protein [Candidatus Methylobacter oryzae]|uniref:YigZ family protein n=1 Tax=Candidatus Methylobacter oryzae TaxID=2497749 RepID=A0ABY3C691_9GAMM|nr:YigZ family protein [Candidatus Methylobacter oryzae]TRW90776.1 YigZ family protein [Candidatus Methylobacter oryzae]